MKAHTIFSAFLGGCRKFVFPNFFDIAYVLPNIKKTRMFFIAKSHAGCCKFFVCSESLCVSPVLR